MLRRSNKKRQSAYFEKEANMIKAIKSRRSVRLFDQEKEISESAILKILEAAHFAPSAKNQQPWHYVIIRNSDVIRKIMMTNTPFRCEGSRIGEDYDKKCNINLPKAIAAVFFDKKKSVFCDPKYYGNIDKKGWDGIEDYSYSDIISIGCSIQNFVLAAHQLGIGTCILGDILEEGINPEIYDWINVDRRRFQLMSGIIMGYSSRDMSNAKGFRNLLTKHYEVIE